MAQIVKLPLRFYILRVYVVMQWINVIVIVAKSNPIVCFPPIAALKRPDTF